MDRSSEVEDALGRMYQALMSGDLDAFIGMIADDVIVIGTDPEEWWEGKEAATRVFREQAESLGGGFPLEVGESKGFASGEIGWFASRPSFLVEGDRVPCRHTGVMRRAGDGWELVESHISIGIRNEEALGEELPT